MSSRIIVDSAALMCHVLEALSRLVFPISSSNKFSHPGARSLWRPYCRRLRGRRGAPSSPWSFPPRAPASRPAPGLGRFSAFPGPVYPAAQLRLVGRVPRQLGRVVPPGCRVWFGCVGDQPLAKCRALRLPWLASLAGRWPVSASLPRCLPTGFILFPRSHRCQPRDHGHTCPCPSYRFHHVPRIRRRGWVRMESETRS